MAVTIPYEAATNGDKALLDLQRALAKFGCQSFGTMIDADRGCTMVQFKHRGRSVSLEASWKGYAAVWLKAHPQKYGRTSKLEHEQRAMKQAQISVCSLLRDWVKGQVTAIECGAMSFEEAFMPHMLTDDGMRVIDRVKSENLLPKPIE